MMSNAKTIYSQSTESDNLSIDEDDNQIDQINIHLKNNLINQAKQFKDIFDKFHSKFNSSAVSEYFLLSQKWLKQWKKYVSYQNIISNKQPDQKYFGKVQIEQANQDLILQTTFETHEYLSKEDPEEGENIILKPHLKENIDYIIIDYQIIQFFNKNHYKIIQIPRKSINKGKQKIVEIYYKQVPLIFFTQEILEKLLKEKNENMFQSLKKLQVFSGETIDDFKFSLIYQAKKNAKSPPQQLTVNNMKIWKIETQKISLQSFCQYILNQSQDYEKEPSKYKFKVPLICLENNPDQTIEEMDIDNNQNDILIIEIQKNKQNWLFRTEEEENTNEVQCDFCRHYKILKYECTCAKAKYCSETCKLKDFQYHIKVCGNDESRNNSDDEQDIELDQQINYYFQENKDFVFKPNAAKGICGLINLGNTCFMNSALQCLSNTQTLTKFFFNKSYKQEINLTNPLGTKGKLAKKYAQLIKGLWMKTQRIFNPIGIKLVISDLQYMFSGHQQHDSQEFLSFILDGLHEDLNRVKNKINTTSINSDGREDSIVAFESWINHIKRNQSVIVDLMQGQFKSKVTCPQCLFESVTFDPFMSCSLPIPYKNIKCISIHILFANNRQFSCEDKYYYEAQSNEKVENLIDYISRKYKLNKNNLLFCCLTFSQLKKIYSLNKSLQEIRKMQKYINQKSVLIEFPSDVSNNNGSNVIIPLEFNKYKDENIYIGKNIKQSLTYVHPFVFNQTDTLKQIHLQLFQFLKPLILNENNENISLEELYQQTVLEQSEEKRPYKLQIVTNPKDFHHKDCFWCDSKQCNNCELKYDENQTIQQALDKNIDKSHVFKLECFFNGVFATKFSSINVIKKPKDDQILQQVQQEQDLIKKENDVNIYDCLKLFEQPEKLENNNEWFCPKCQKFQKATKQMTIYRIPDILIFHLKRFKTSAGTIKSKITKIIDFPLKNLDMTPYVIEKESPYEYYSQKEHQLNEENLFIKSSFQLLNQRKEVNEDNKLLYDLYAVTNHYGSLGFGHYTAYAKNEGLWYRFDDQNVERINHQNICSEGSYILFYERQK